MLKKLLLTSLMCWTMIGNSEIINLPFKTIKLNIKNIDLWHNNTKKYILKNGPFIKKDNGYGLNNLLYVDTFFNIINSNQGYQNEIY